MSDSNDLFSALDRSIAEMVKRAQLDTKICARVRTLMRENGLTYGYSEDEALEQAIFEVTGRGAK
jgi:G:T-mismatch repair DNA endonuclease (very short patch repair protein)